MTDKNGDVGRLRALAKRAMLDGAFTDPETGRVTWHIASRCEAPTTIELHARDLGPGDRNRAQTVALAVRCRKCLACRTLRSYEWTTRAKLECLMHSRTFFGTLTLTPQNHYQFLAGTIKRLAERQVRYDGLSTDEQFSELVSTIGAGVTRYIKRIRETTGKACRYLLVAEAHKSGLPHFHMLFHEVETYTADAFDTYTVLKDQWPYGHCDWSGIDRNDTSAAFYVCKYLVKSSLQRVRCSGAYGRLLDFQLKSSINPKSSLSVARDATPNADPPSSA